MNWKTKLSSRKFWVSVCGLASALLAAFHFSDEATRVTSILMALGAVVSYVLAEGFVDASSASGADTSAPASGSVPAAGGTAADGTAPKP